MIVNCHSYYSLRYGTLSIRELVDFAKEYGISTLALTDINNTSAALDFVRYAKSHGIKSVIGVEFRNSGELLYTALAKNNEAYYRINKYLSSFLLNRVSIDTIAPALKDVIIIYPYGKIHPSELSDDEFISVLPHQVNHVIKYHKQYHDKLVALHTISFKRKENDYRLHKILRAIDLCTILSKLKEADLAPANQFFVGQTQLKKKYQLFPILIDNSQNILDQCSIDFEFGTPKNKASFTESLEKDNALLLSLAKKGFAYRYEKQNPKALERFNKEIKVIKQLGFSPYFLITWDILRYAKTKGFHHVGRGSGANSIIAYCLKITDVDPIKLDLYFERFINPHRTSPPDFDIDFSWDERDTVIDYVFSKYGPEHVALIATYTTFKGRSAIREIAKTFGFPKEEIDRIIRQPDHVLNANQITKQLFKYVSLLEGVPNYLGIHAGGIIISEKSLYNYTGMQMPPKGFPIVQWDMHVAEDIGFYKFDILSQRGLGHIKEAVQIIKKNQGVEVDIHQVEKFQEDLQVQKQLKSGDTVGCFYIESPAMRGLLNKLRCDNYISLVAASSIIRPGVAKSGMMKLYIERFHKAKFAYLHPIMEKLLEETYGIMIYQEDVIKVAHYFAGIDLADADVLRRAMSGKYRSKKEMQRVINLFFDNCKAKGYPDELTNEVWRQIESFSGYSFSKAHSASYAVESFQSLYLKAHYPLEFMVAVINNRGGFYSTEFYVHEARVAGATINEPCINKSEQNACIYGEEIYIGLSFVKELEYKLVKKILCARAEDGIYIDLIDFIERTNVSVEQLFILIRINALRFTEMSKKQLMWQSQFILKGVAKVSETASLFKIQTQTFELPKLMHNPYDDIIDQIQLLNYPLCSPFSLIKGRLEKSILASDLSQQEGQIVVITGYYVNEKKVRTSKGDIMKFGCFVDLNGKFFDTVFFSQVLKQYPLQGKGCYYMMGKVVLEFGYPSIEVIKMKKMELKSRGEYVVEQIEISNTTDVSFLKDFLPII
ncbi:DNA polymerase III subunit alpha [Flavobacteriales bacterium]|nr:DNA polymerase III subunit alpha [Flavobacteriales bacterium]